MRLAIGQINTRVGDFDGNLEKLVSQVKEASGLGADIIAFPEMAICGYPLEDLAFRGSFLAACDITLQKLLRHLKSSKMVVIAGGVETGDTLYNSAFVLQGGEILGRARKRYLFCCGRFDESRYFRAGERPLVIETDAFRAAVTLGDDFGYPVFPAEVDLLINLWNEPYQYGRRPLRGRMMTERAQEDAVSIAMVSPAGCQDDMIFEGSSKIVDGFGEVLARGAGFAEDLVVADLDLPTLQAHRARTYHTFQQKDQHLARARRVRLEAYPAGRKKPSRISCRVKPLLSGPEELFTALSFSIREFVEKNGMDKAVVGLSGGIDSAVVALLAREALGADGLICVSMPGPHTSAESKKNASRLARNLAAEFMEVSIKGLYTRTLQSLSRAFEGFEPDVTEENLQARLRGMVLMAIANKRMAAVLAPGNKSETATGYCTLYGDTVGAFAPLCDVYKTRVYELASWYNKKAGKMIIPQNVFERAPTAELKPLQTDQDRLPSYSELDRILEGLLEKDLSARELIARGESEHTVYQVLCMLLQSEFKRRQAPPGPTVSERPLSDLRLPVSKSLGWWNIAAPAAADKEAKARKKGSAKGSAQ
ncbi:MAG: NAD+ synthase [bacterium]